MVPKPMSSSMNAFKNLIGTNNHQQSHQSDKHHFNLDSPNGKHYHGDSHVAAAKMSPALKRSLLNDLKPMAMMRKMGSSRSLVSLTSLSNDNNNNVSLPNLGQVKVRQPVDASPRGLSKSNPSLDYDYEAHHHQQQQQQQPSKRRTSIRSAAERSQDAIRRASIRSLESITCRQSNATRTDLLTKQDSAKSLNSLKSGHSFQQESLDEGDGGNQLRGILLARKTELSASRSDLRIPSPLFTEENDDSKNNDDDISVLSEGDSSIAESMGNTPLNSPQPSKPPMASPGFSDFDQIEQEKLELQRMIAQLELETREMEQRIERTKSQNDLLRNNNNNYDSLEKEPQVEYKPPPPPPPPQKEYHKQEPEYKRFVQPSAALKILSPTDEPTKRTPVRTRPPIDPRQMAGLLAQLDSDFPPIGLAESNHAKVEKHMESPATSMALLEARVLQLTVSPRAGITSPPHASVTSDDYDSETDSHSESHSSDYSSNTEPSSSDELEKSQNFQKSPQSLQEAAPQTFQQEARTDSFEQDAGDWLIEQIARGNETISQISSQPPTMPGPTQTTLPTAGFIPGSDDASMYSDSTWTFYTLKSNKTGSSRSVMTASNYLPKWTAPPTRPPPTSYDEIRQYHDSAASSMASSVHSQSDYYPGLAMMQRVPPTPRPVRSDPPERGRPQEMDSPTSTLESNIDPPADTNQAIAPLRIQPTIPEEEYLEPDTTLPSVISFNSFEKFDDDEVSAMSAKGRKVERRTSKSSNSPPPESVSTHMDHEDASLGNSDSSSELSDVGLMLKEIEDKDHLLKQLHDSGLLQLDTEQSSRSRSRSSQSNPARTTNRIHLNRSSSTDKEKTKTKKKKLANTRELLERSKLASKRKDKNENDDSEHEPPKPISTLSLDTKRSSSTKSSKPKRTKSTERTKSRSPRPSKVKEIEEVPRTKSSERTKSRSPRPSKVKDLEEVQVSKRSERTKSRSPRPSKAKDLEEVSVVKDRVRSKSADRGMERTKSDKKNEVSKSRSRSKSTERLTQKFSSSRSIESSKSKSSKANRTKSLSPPPAKTKKDDKVRLRSKSNERSMATDSVTKKEKVVSRGLDKTKSLDNVDRVARAAKVLERARSSRRDSSEEPKRKRASSKEEVSIKSRHERSSSKEKKRNKSKEVSSRRGTRRSAVLEMSTHSHDRSVSSERSRQKESSKSSRKSLKSASNIQSATLKRPKSTESIGLRAMSKRNDSMLQSQSLHNDRFVLEIPKARSNEDLVSFSLSGNKTNAMSRYFERSRKKDYLSYTTH